MLNAKDFNRKKFDDNWLGIVLPQSSQDRQMEGFGGYAIRRKVAIIGHTPSNRGEIDDKDVVFAIVALPLIGGTGAAGTKQTPRISQGDVVYGTFLDKDTKQQPIILGALGRTGKVKYEKGVYGRYDITSGFVGSLQPLKLFGRGQTNEDNRDCSPISIPFEDAMRVGAEMLSEKGGVPTEPTVGAIPAPPKLGEIEIDPDIDEKITNAENAVQRLEDTQAAFDAQEAASEGSTDREAYEENEEKLNDARSEVNSLKKAKNTAEERLNATQQDFRDKLGFPLQTGANQEEVNRLKESLNKPVGEEPVGEVREAWNEWNAKESASNIKKRPPTLLKRLRDATELRKRGVGGNATGPDIELYPTDNVSQFVEISNERKNEQLLRARYGGTGRPIEIGDKIYQPWDPNYLNAFNQASRIPRS